MRESLREERTNQEGTVKKRTSPKKLLDFAGANTGNKGKQTVPIN